LNRIFVASLVIEIRVNVPATTVNVRYIVDDVSAAIAFYTTHLGFALAENATPAFAVVTRGQLPIPGGWNRIQVLVSDLAAEAERLRTAGLRFRNEIVTGVGGAQILLDRPIWQPH